MILKPSPLVGVVLAGGRSTRMGCDKALIQVSGEPQWERLARVLSTICPHVIVSKRSDQLFSKPPFTYVHDSAGVHGPGAGIIAAHECYRDYSLLVVSVDLFLTTSEMLKEFVGKRNPNKEATVLSENNEFGFGLFPSIWEVSALQKLKSRLPECRMSPRALLSQLDIEKCTCSGDFRDFDVPSDFYTTDEAFTLV